jgi:hypothetical protein
VKTGDYYGPARMMELRGNPILVKSTEDSHNEKIAKELWDLSETLTGVKY